MCHKGLKQLNFLSFDEFISYFFAKAVRNKNLSVSFVKLVLEFDPMQTQGVQEAFHRVHAEEDTERGAGQHRETQDHLRKEQSTIGMPRYPLTMPPSTVFWKKTSDSWEWASERAHSLR